jgi:esterase
LLPPPAAVILSRVARLNSYQLGDGDQPLVLLHGFLGMGKNLRSLGQGLLARQPGLRLLVPDLTGHGASPPLPPDASLATLAGDVLETIAAAAFATPLGIIGHSLGGRVALAAARQAPGVIDQVTFLDIGPGPVDERHSGSRRVLDVLLEAPDSAPSRRELRQYLIDHALSPALADWLVMNVRLDPDGRAHWSFDRRALDRLQVATSAEDLWDVIGTVPCRCVRGSRSSYVSDTDAGHLATRGCPVTTLESGHDVHVEALPALLDALTSR